MFARKGTVKNWSRMTDKFSSDNLSAKKYEKNKERFKRKKRDKDAGGSSTEKIVLVFALIILFFIFGSFVFYDNNQSASTHFIHW